MSLKIESDVSPPCADTLTKLVSGFPGGYWRHGFVDHVLLINPYFPTADFVEELQSALPRLLAHYPSIGGEIEESVGRLIGQPSNCIAVGNGVIEIISNLLPRTGLSLAVPTPSFNPYEDYPLPEKLARFALEPPDFVLDMDTYAVFVEKSGVDAAVIISPHNPTSTLVNRNDVLRLAGRLQELGKLLFVDESFIEFAPLGRAESVENAVDEYENLIVLKSLGKTYGTCGLRMGYLLSSDAKFVESVRRSLPTWNINVLAEYAMSRLPDFAIPAAESWERVKLDRDILFEDLQGFPGLHVLRPNANYVFARLPEQWPDGPDIAERMLRRYKILLRHCESKTMREGERYLRIAARTQPENKHLIECLHDITDNL